MAISDNYVPVKQQGNGATVNYGASWPIFAAAYIRVYLESVATGVQALQVLGTNYTLTFDDNGFVVTFISGAPTAADYVVIGRSIALDQTNPYKTSKGFDGLKIEGSYDKLTGMVQDLSDAVGRSLVFPLGDTTSTQLPTATARALGFLGFDAIGAPAVYAGVAGVAISAAMVPVVQAPTIALARSALGVVASNDVKVQDFRLTLTSGLPVTTADVTAATTLYCTPYKGRGISLYDGTNWNIRSSAEFSLALGVLTSGRPYDVFCYDNAGVPTLEVLAWTNDTTRATALVYQDGVLARSGALTRRYLGTFYTTTTTTTEDSLVKRFLYNYYNRVARPMRRTDATASWNYTTNTLRQANGATANQLDFVQGVAEDAVSATVVSTARNTVAGTLLNSGIGVDSTSVNSSLTGLYRAPITNYEVLMSASYEGIPGVGRHFLAWLEQSGAAGTTTWNGTQSETVSGITGRVMA